MELFFFPLYFHEKLITYVFMGLCLSPHYFNSLMLDYFSCFLYTHTSSPSSPCVCTAHSSTFCRSFSQMRFCSLYFQQLICCISNFIALCLCLPYSQTLVLFYFCLWFSYIFKKLFILK
jgi:hypothetical protein